MEQRFSQKDKIMKCAVCHGEMKKKKSQLELTVKGVLYILEKVPYEACAECGEKVLKPEISRWIFDQIRKKQFYKKIIELPFIPACNI